MKVLLTAFEPFDGETINPSSEAVKLVRDEIAKATIVKCYVPVVFKEAIETVYNAMKKENPDIVICIGQAGGRKEITPERVAINCDDARIKDNQGNQPIDQKIYEDGADAYFSTLPIKEIVEAINKKNIPAAISNSAGTFVCNHLMYGVLYHIKKEFPNTIGGFVHVPYLHEQVVNKNDVASLSKEEIVEAIEIIIETTVNYKNH